MRRSVHYRRFFIESNFKRSPIDVTEGRCFVREIVAIADHDPNMFRRRRGNRRAMLRNPRQCNAGNICKLRDRIARSAVGAV